MKPSSAKKKGQLFVAEIARMICNALKINPDDMRVTPSGVNGPDLWISPAGLKRFPFVVEAKNQQAMNIWSALTQANSHAVGTSLVPLLVFRRNRSEAYVCLHIDDFLGLMAELNTHKFNEVSSGGDENAEKSRVLF